MDRQFTDYFGFDLGDGESAVAWMRPGKRTEPQMIELRGRKSMITAIGEHPQKGVLIGEEACHMSGLNWLEVRFKSRYLADQKGTGRMIERFARAVLENLRADGRLSDPETACFFIGCPSGWPQHVRDSYREHFVAAGMVHCEVVSESRAAFMFARESGELRVSDDLLTRPTLIIDAGSSTTDFTYVADLAERSLKASDFGEVSLGGGLLDKMLLEMNLSRSERAEEISGIMGRYPSYAARCELEARRVKEMFFTQQMRESGLICESAVKIYAGREPITLDIACADEDMKRILATPVEALGGKTFEQAYREALMGAKEELHETPPEIILLTGGASRMPLMERICREQFPEAEVLRGLEPEYAIARGLCHALRIDQKTKGFSDAVQALIHSEDMEDLVMSRLPELYEAVSGPIADKLVDEVGPEVFSLWREGGLRTMGDISAELTRRAQRMLEEGEMTEALRPAVGRWIEKLRPEIESMTDPICDEYDLPRTSLRLPDTLSIQATQLQLKSAQLMRADELKAIVDVALGAIVAGILGGSGMALLATGLPGLVAGFGWYRDSATSFNES